MVSRCPDTMFSDPIPEAFVPSSRLLVLAALFAAPLAAQSPKTGTDVLRAMHDRYAGKWYRTLTFIQTTTRANGAVETWYEAMAVPGLLRIDIAPLDSGSAYIFRNDSLYVMAGGKVRQARSFVHPLLVLGFDVYGQPVATTAEKLASLHFDLATLRTGTWQGRPAYVVGDTTTNAFWVDRDRLVFVRMVQHQNGVVAETRFNKYVPIGGGWVAAEVMFRRDGKPAGKEEYAELKTGRRFTAGFFDPARFTRPAWVGNR